ncbi:gamma-tubulin complex component 2-like isoform X2 [Oratosquilla oratoria]|uniref:gamma-tubulin complex component 2-like isoform X2 n=1 Tax=Oratosquilla oratoria TaxID=337810 RepID=UPI003F773C15
MSEFKVHHHLSELCSLLGVGPNVAEKYSENLSKYVKPFLSVQVLTSNAVKTLATNAPDPQAFLDKYSELKNRNVHNLDALVVFLSGLLEDGKARDVVGEASKARMSEEGLSFTTVPTVVAEIEQAANTKLSQDELNELKNRLLKESQLTHAPSEAHCQALGLEKKRAMLGPATPTWLSSRPYLSLDFIFSEKSSNAAPLGDVSVSSQEYQLLEDVLSVMLGIDGTYITVKPSGKPHLPPTFTVDSSVEPSLRALVNRVLPICGHYSVVICFMEERSLYHHGLVNQALAAAIRNLMKDYMLLVTQLETQQLRGVLTLHKLWFYVEKTLTVMEMLARLVSNLSKSESHGGAVLSLLHERSLSLTGCGQLQEVTLYLAQAAAVPYMKMLTKWIYRGIVSDPYNEFMITDNEEKKKESEEFSIEDNTDEYWMKRYTIRTHNIPSFLQSYADIILRTGKYFNVIRDSDNTFVCPQQEELLYSVGDKSYVYAIERTYSFASKRLLQLLMKDKDLMGRLRSVKHYFLLDQGDFVMHLLSLCECELSKNIDDVVPTRLESLVELALRTAAVNVDPYKDDVHCVLLPFSLMNQMLRILSIDTVEEREYWPPHDRLQLSGLQGFSLNYHVTWPVSLVLDKKSIACYQMIFRHLFFCKYVERLLCRVWLSNKVAKSFPLSASRTYASAFTLRQRMLNFIQNIEYYMMIEVIERNWQSFIAKMKNVENVDEVMLCHSNFLNSVLKDCMLTSPELLRIVSKMMAICVSFANFILSPEPDTSIHEANHEESESFEQTIARFDLQFTGMLVTLVGSISDLGRDEYNDGLVNVLHRLDCNNFYTKKSEGLNVVSSPEGSLEYMNGPASG